MSGLGVDGPGHAIGSHLKGFDLSTGDGKLSAQFPGKTNLCNDMTVASDGTVYVTNSLAPQILQLKLGGKTLEVWVENKQFQPPSGIGLDGIAIGSDGDIYVNTFNGGDFFHVEVKDGKPGTVAKLETSRPLILLDGLRLVSGKNFLMVEGSGSLDRVTVNAIRSVSRPSRTGSKSQPPLQRWAARLGPRKVSCRIFINAKANVHRAFRSKSCQSL